MTQRESPQDASLPPQSVLTQISSAQSASGSSFYAGMRILPPVQRQAIYDIYRYCRQVDDIADGDAPVADPQAALDEWRRSIEAIYAGEHGGQAEFLAPHIHRYRLKKEDFLAVIDGMEMDLHGPIVAPRRAVLDLYCDRVASAVGRLSTPVFGVKDCFGVPLAQHLGRALQLTNILRDLDEDADRGRLYLSLEDLQAVGITDVSAPDAVLAHPRLAQACAPLLQAAQKHFTAADALMDACNRKSVRAPRLMGSAYADVARRLEKRGFAPPRARIGVNKPRLILAYLRWGLL